METAETFSEVRLKLALDNIGFRFSGNQKKIKEDQMVSQLDFDLSN